MVFDEVLKRFVEKSPVCVMFRGVLENMVTESLLDEIFSKTARRQYAHELLFSSLVYLLSLVVVRTRRSVNDAYRAEQERYAVSVAAVYDKLQGVETEVSRQLVRQTAQRIRQVAGHLVKRRPPLLRGYQAKIVDGNHLAKTEHRLKELRTIGAGPLPGLALVVLEPDLMLITDAFPCEDGHAQERTLLPAVLETVERRDVWIADRNFCTTEFLFGIAARGGFFIIRQHGSTLTYDPPTKRRKIGLTSTGEVYEEQLRLHHPDGRELLVRRILVKLYEPTQDGDTEVYLLTNLPQRAAGARKVAELYLGRWTVENAFQELEQAFHSEIATLAYPKAALLSFCVALLTYNVISVVKSALAAVHGEAAERKTLSGYYLAGEIATMYQGMMVAVPPPKWRRFADLTPVQLARVLKQLAAGVGVDRFRKNVRGPKRPPPKRTSGKRQKHVSTAQIVAQRTAVKTHATTA